MRLWVMRGLLVTGREELLTGAARRRSCGNGTNNFYSRGVFFVGSVFLFLATSTSLLKDLRAVSRVGL